MEELSKKSFKLTKLDIVGIVLILLFLPIIIINATLVIKGMVNPNKVPTIFGYAPLIVISDSMDLEYGDPGAFNRNDLIIVKEIDTDLLLPNDIISYMDEDNKVVTHRIKRIEYIEGEKVFITKGDFSVSEDPAVYPDKVVGVYVTRFAKLGGVANFIQKPIGVVILLGIPIIIYLGIDLFNKNKQKKASQAKNEELEAEIARLKTEAKLREETNQDKLNEDKTEEVTILDNVTTKNDESDS